MVFRGFCLERGIDFINFCLKQGIVQDLMYSLTTEPSQKANIYQFANVQHIEMRNSL